MSSTVSNSVTIEDASVVEPLDTVQRPVTPPPPDQSPWRVAGRYVGDALTSADAIVKAGLDWRVEQHDLAYTGSDGETYKVEAAKINVRSDTGGQLGIVSDSYTVFQNSEAFDFMDELVGDRLAMFETAGALAGGRRVWMLAAVPREYRLGDGGGDVVKPYILLHNAHDGTRRLRMIPTTIRVVCQNTLNLALRNATASEGIYIAHTGTLRDRVRDARRALGIVTARFDELDAELHSLIAEQLDSQRLSDYFDAVVPPANPESPRSVSMRASTLEVLQENFVNPRNSVPGIRGSAWAAYNAFSEWVDHGRQTRGRNDTERAESRLSSMWFGGGNQLKQRAYAEALELVGA